MLRKLVFSMVVMVVAVGVVAAAEYSASITKVDGDKVSFTTKVKKDKKEMTLPAAAGVKVLNATKKTDKATKKSEYVEGDAIADGLKGIKIGDKGTAARIITEGEGDKEKITKILVLTK